MPYRNEKEAWVRRSEEAETRALAAETALRELASMKAKAPWRMFLGSMALLILGGIAGWKLAPPEHRPGSFTALSTQAMALRSRSLFTWRATPRADAGLVPPGDECLLSVDAQDNDGDEDRPVREIHVRLECRSGYFYTTSHFDYGERRVGACAMSTGDVSSTFCTFASYVPGRASGDETRIYIDTRAGTMTLRDEGVGAEFDLESVEEIQSPSAPSPVRHRGRTTFESTASITHVSGIPSEGALARPRIRVGAQCGVLVRSDNSARETQCEVEIECAGTHFEARGICTLDEVGQIERVVDLTVSRPQGRRGDGNASVVFDVRERELVLMEDEGYEAFLVQMSVDSSRSRARFL